MSEQYTPGPLLWSESDPKRAAGIHLPNGDCIGTAHHDADARLWAAAHALLEACERVYRVAVDADLPGPVHLSIEERNLLRVAIAKARGTQP